MVVLVAGATGFIGGALARLLCARGHRVIGTARAPKAMPEGGAVARWVPADYTRDLAPADWVRWLDGVDVAINAVGIFRESGATTFEAVHVQAPRALFAACVRARVRIVQISALGADEHATSAYHLSKRAADEFLLQIDPRAVVVQPSLVYGRLGASAALFNFLASLPLIPLPGNGAQLVQPIHIDDLVAAVANLAERDGLPGRRVPVVGQSAVTIREYLGVLRESMRLGRPAFVSIPEKLVAVVARLASLFPHALLSADSLQMLNRGNTADAAETSRLLGRPPRPVSAFIPPAEARQAAFTAKAVWLLALLRIAVAIVWLVSGIVSLGLYPVEESYRLLARVGVTGALAPIALYGAALLDIAFGIASIAPRRARYLWAVQAAVIVGYMVLITVALPEFWLHPFGPIVKNLPMLAALWVLHEYERG